MKRIRDTDGSVEVVLCRHDSSGYSLITSGEPITTTNLSELSKEMVRLPYKLSNPSVMDAVNEEISEKMTDLPNEFTDSVWLKNELILPLDRELSIDLRVNKQVYSISYDRAIGIKAEKEE